MQQQRVGGYNLKGDGVVIGVGDDADPQYHVDFTGRLINFAPAGYFYHGTHVYGTVGGGGIVGEQYARLCTEVYDRLRKILLVLLTNAPTYVTRLWHGSNE